MDSANPEQSYGKLGIRAFSANSAYPVAGAFVTVRKKKGDTVETVAVLETDESGLTPLITLEAPPKSLSLSPGDDGVPYSLYDVEINGDGYYTVMARDVQIYPDTTSILPVNMIPLPDNYLSERFPSDEIIMGGGGDSPNL